MRRLAVLAAIALVAAGCGGGGTGGAGGSGGDLIASAAAKSSQADSVKADFAIAGSGVEGRGNGVFDKGGQGAGHLTMAVTSQGQTVTIETVNVGSVVYMRSAVFSRLGLPAGKEWVRLDLGRLAKQNGVDLGSLLDSSPNPNGALAYLGGSTGNERKVGSEKVQGVPTTHYRATIDLAQAARNAHGSARDSIRRVIDVSGLKVIPVDVWVDHDGYVRKLIYSQVAGTQQSAQVTMELHDFGSHVQIASPPSDSVIDFMEILKQPQGQ
jgi:hypothetical protein